MGISLGPHQLKAIDELDTGKVLIGGVGTGKSMTALAYWWTVVCDGELRVNDRDGWKPPTKKVDLYIITTARKRNSLDWVKELAQIGLSEGSEGGLEGITVTVESWNNIKKFEAVRGAFFVFDEQRLVGSGAWVKSFYKIANRNMWILLSATPADTWMDLVPVFVANGFYKNKSEFVERHCIYSRWSKFPKVDKYVGIKRLEHYRDLIYVDMPYTRHTSRHRERIFVEFDRECYRKVMKTRQNPETGEPFANNSAFLSYLRRVSNTSKERYETLKTLVLKHRKVIIFYNFDYELELLRALRDDLGSSFELAEWNGHLHQEVPEGSDWVYLVQYTAGSEAWNCITSDTIVFYSLNYSHRIMEQSEGRIDRLNSPYIDLFYYRLMSSSPLDLGIWEALRRKKTFSEARFVAKMGDVS